MSLTIELTAAEETAIRAAAEREGMDVTAFAREQIVRAARPASVKEDDLISFLRNNGNAATRAARENLHAQGIGYVVAQVDGAVVERLPDGSTTILHAIGTVAE